MVKIPCTAEGRRQDQVDERSAVPYVIPAARSPPENRVSHQIKRPWRLVFPTDVEEGHENPEPDGSPFHGESFGQIDWRADERHAIAHPDHEATNDKHGNVLGGCL